MYFAWKSYGHPMEDERRSTFSLKITIVVFIVVLKPHLINLANVYMIVAIMVLSLATFATGF